MLAAHRVGVAEVDRPGPGIGISVKQSPWTRKGTVSRVSGAAEISTYLRLQKLSADRGAGRRRALWEREAQVCRSRTDNLKRTVRFPAIRRALPTDGAWADYCRSAALLLATFAAAAGSRSPLPPRPSSRTSSSAVRFRWWNQFWSLGDEGNPMRRTRSRKRGEERMASNSGAVRMKSVVGRCSS